jgi:hypothetical protein
LGNGSSKTALSLREIALGEPTRREIKEAKTDLICLPCGQNWRQFMSRRGGPRCCAPPCHCEARREVILELTENTVRVAVDGGERRRW